jgi:microcystin-dependent protein
MFERFRNFALTVALLLIAAGAQPAYTAIWQWSKTSATNGTADPNIDWSEGMSPSSINDSARAMMSQLAGWRDDISGLLTTSGSSTAYTVTTNSGYCPSATAPPDGTLISATVNAANGAAPTLTVDSCTAAPIQVSAATAIPAGTLIAGTPYSFRYSVANTAWMLKGFFSTPTNVPLGGLVPYTLANAPNSNFVLPAGQCISTVTYATYWNALGQPGQGGCSVNQFAIIDLRGRTPVALDNLNGSVAGRMTTGGCGIALTSIGTVCPNGAENRALSAAQIPSISFSGSGSVSAATDVSNILQGSNFLSTFLQSGGNLIYVPNNAGGPPGASQVHVSGSASVSGNSTNTGGQAFPSIGPSIGVSYLLRVL